MSEDTTDIDYVWVCDDCAMWWTNADLPCDLDPDVPEDADRLEEIRNGTPVIVDCGECASECVGFSTRWCDSCDSKLAGSRHRAIVDTDRQTLPAPDRMVAMNEENLL